MTFYCPRRSHGYPDGRCRSAVRPLEQVGVDRQRDHRRRMPQPTADCNHIETAGDESQGVRVPQSLNLPSKLQWGPAVAAEAEVEKGDRVLDVACGTGALTLAAVEIAGPSGSVVGLTQTRMMRWKTRPATASWLCCSIGSSGGGGDAFRAPFSLGDAGWLHEICSAAGFPDAEVVQRDRKVRFKSIDALVSTERACV